MTNNNTFVNKNGALVKYLEQLGRVSKLTKKAFALGSNFKGDYNLHGEIAGGLFLAPEGVRTRTVNFEVIEDAVTLAKLLVSKADVIFNKVAYSYEDVNYKIKGLQDWATYAEKVLIDNTNYINTDTITREAAIAKYEFIYNQICWDGFLLALGEFTCTNNATLAECSAKTISLAYALDILF